MVTSREGSFFISIVNVLLVKPQHLCWGFFILKHLTLFFYNLLYFFVSVNSSSEYFIIIEVFTQQTSHKNPTQVGFCVLIILYS